MVVPSTLCANLYDFAFCPEPCYDRLVDLADPEDWGAGNRILKNYLSFSFSRAVYLVGRDAQTGALIGIVNAGYKSSAAQGLSFAIPCGTVKAVMDKLLDKGYVEGNFDFGVSFEAKVFYVNTWSTTTYVVVSGIDAYGTFSKGGIESGDIILSVKVGDK